MGLEMFNINVILMHSHLHAQASEKAEDSAVSEKYLIATSEQPIAAFHRCGRETEIYIQYIHMLAYTLAHTEQETNWRL